MPKTEYVKMSYQEISNLLNGLYTRDEMARALNMSREKLVTNGARIPQSVINDPQEFNRLIESSMPKNRLR